MASNAHLTSFPGGGGGAPPPPPPPFTDTMMRKDTDKQESQADTLEEQLRDALLERPIEITLGTTNYKVPPITIATLVEASAVISELEKVTGGEFSLEQIQDDPEGVTSWAVRHAHAGTTMAKVVATFVVGAKKIRDDRQERKNPVTRLFKRRPAIDRVTGQIEEELNFEELYNLFTTLLSQSRISHFFALSTFLAGANIARRRVEQETKTTPPGR